jgi:hypothetical protein
MKSKHRLTQESFGQRGFLEAMNNKPKQDENKRGSSI